MNKSDAGKKMMTSMPQLMQQSMSEMIALLSPRLNALTGKLANEAVETAKNKPASLPAKSPSPAK